jgi:VanZ family protein
LALAGFATLYFASPSFAGDYGIGSLSDDFVRDVAHVVVYGSLAAMLGWALSWRTLAWTISVLCSAGEEFHQLFVPWRFGCVSDWLLNVLGITLFLVASHLIATRMHGRARDGVLLGVNPGM